MPAVPGPEVFGMHANAGFTRDLRAARQMFSSLVSVLAESDGVSASGSDDAAADGLITEIASVVLARLPSDFDVDAAAARTDPMDVVFVQEMDRYNSLLRAVRRTLEELCRAVRGAVAMTPELEAAAVSLSASRCPATWARLSYPSHKPLAGYVTDLVDRLRFLRVSTHETSPLPLSPFFSFKIGNTPTPGKACVITSGVGRHRLLTKYILK